MTTLSELIQHDKPISTGAFSVYPYSVKLERQMRFTSRFGEEVPLCRADLDAKRLFLPRALCPVGDSDERVVGDPVKFPADPMPRDYQEQLFKETEEFLAAGQSGVVVAFTGLGQDCARLSRGVCDGPQDPGRHHQGRHLQAVDRGGAEVPAAACSDGSARSAATSARCRGPSSASP